MINIFSWAFTCSLVLLCTLDEDFWIQVLGFLLWVFHPVFILGFFPCFVICWSCFWWGFSFKDFGFEFSPCLFVYSGYFDFFLFTTWLLLDSLDHFSCPWCDGSLMGCCLAMLSLIFLLLCDRVLAFQPLWLSPLGKKTWLRVLWTPILDMITWWMKFIHVNFHP